MHALALGLDVNVLYSYITEITFNSNSIRVPYHCKSAVCLQRCDDVTKIQRILCVWWRLHVIVVPDLFSKV